MENRQTIKDLVQKSKKALMELESYTQEQIDALIKAVAFEVRGKAEELAKEAVEETGFGKYEHKVIKNIGTADIMWSYLKDKKSIGIIKKDLDDGIEYVAKPKGVIGVVAPTTNPNITALCNGLYALKGRNTVIIAPHPRAKHTTAHTVKIMNDALREQNAPENIFQVIEEPSIELTQELMSAVDVIVATGGMAMVKAAYSSGKPAFGVGAGNVQTILDRDFDYEEAVSQITEGRIFDNGLICAGNQSVIMPVEEKDNIISLFEKNKVYYSENPSIVNKLKNTIFVDGHINPKVVGQTALFIAKLAGVEIPSDTAAILLKADKTGSDDLLCGEKMCPVLVALTYDDFNEAVEMARENLLYQGAGHTAVIHSNNKGRIRYAGEMLPVSRLLVNQPGIAAAGTIFLNKLNPTTTLGCGSWGNNSLSENLTYEHLINISRIAFPNPGAVQP